MNVSVPPMPKKPKKPKRPMSATVTTLIVAVLALVSLGLSGWSLATLLMEVGAPLPVALLGVGVFDGVALLAALQVYERRMQPHTALGARLAMTAALLASAVVNFAHGMAMEGGGWMTAVVLGAAPLAFEIGFELKHRTLTGLVWLLFRGHTMDALRRDAWQRIAPAPVMVDDDTSHTVHREAPAPAADSATAPAPVAPATAAPALPGATATAPALPAGVTAEQLAAALALLNGAQGTAGAPATAPAVQMREDQDDDGEAPAPLEPPTLANLKKADAIRIALRRRPDYTPAQIAEVLADYGVQTTADYVRQVKNRDAETAADGREDQGEEGAVVPLRKQG
ncbi:hypothetical protein ACGRHY_30010 [Streptomyces sp. HK10]|uniref:hypothetical protein n=1 Tax=Streptomyces sp. HK10 TaxID=3373255 RepID=UPI003749EF4F